MNKDNPMLEIDDEMSFLTKGASMRPMLREHKDIAVITSLQKELKKGDVVLYHRDTSDAFVLHRIVDIKNENLVIRGDNNFFLETDIKAEDIIGILKGFFRNGRYFDCEKSRIYKLYVLWIHKSYPIRCFLRCVRLNLSKIKRKLLGKEKA